jgi:hypothetical protein
MGSKRKFPRYGQRRPSGNPRNERGFRHSPPIGFRPEDNVSLKPDLTSVPLTRRKKKSTGDATPHPLSVASHLPLSWVRATLPAHPLCSEVWTLRLEATPGHSQP